METVLNRDGFRLLIGETSYNPEGFYTGNGKLPYELYDDSFDDSTEPIFSACDFGPSPLYSEDGPEAIASLLSFLSLRPGDTDREYFDDYTERQLAWRDSRAESLAMIANDLETAARWADSDQFMSPQIDFGTVYCVETTAGSELCIDAIDADCLEGKMIAGEEPAARETWYGRLSASGYMDCTDWITADSAADVLLDLFYQYGEDFEQ